MKLGLNGVYLQEKNIMTRCKFDTMEEWQNAWDALKGDTIDEKSNNQIDYDLQQGCSQRILNEPNADGVKYALWISPGREECKKLGFCKPKRKKQTNATKTTLYRHYNKEGILLYVGVSLSSLQRLGQHSNNAHWFNSITDIKMKSYASRDIALKKEKEAIISEQPLYNIRHNYSGKKI